MVARPEENTAPGNQFEEARKRTRKLKEKGRGQLVTAAATERAGINLARQRGIEDERSIAMGGGKAFAGAMGRQTGGVGSVGGLGTLQMGIDQARGKARSDAAGGIAEARRKAQAADQEVVKFDIEAEKSVDDLKQERANLDAELKSMAESNPGLAGLGEDEDGMASSIEEWAQDTRPTEAEWDRMIRKAKSEYGVGKFPNRPLKLPRFANGRVAGF